MPTRTLSLFVLPKKPGLLSLVCGLLFILMTASSALAQTFSGLSGTISDASTASVKGAKVTVTSIETGVPRITTSSASGFYSFPNLLAGNYSVRVEASGFQTELNPGIKLDAAVSATVNFALHAGDVSQTVDVQAVGVELDRTSSTIADTFTTAQTENTPVNGRTVTNFALLTPGAALINGTIVQIAFDGLNIYSNYFYIDGVDDTFVYLPTIANGGGRGARLSSGSQETIAEIRTQTSVYQPEYGRAAGGVINFVTKAGTNKYHGEAYDFFRNEALDARTFFARPTPTNASKPRFRYNDFGGQLSGPLVKDKTFFLANYEGSRQTIGYVTQGTVLSSTSRAAALAAHPELAPIVNEEPVGVDSTVNPQLANYNAYGNVHISENTGSMRVDQNFSPKDSMFARYNFNQSEVYGPLYSVGATYFGKDANQDTTTGVTNIAIHEQHIFSPRFLNDALAGLQRSNLILNTATPVPQVTISPLSIVTGSLGVTAIITNGYQYGDSMTMVVKNHTLKWGSTFFRAQVNQHTLNTATITYSSINNFINNSATQIALKAGDPGHGTRGSTISSYVQDNWQVRPNLSINYGLRSDLYTTPHDKNYATAAYNPQSGALFPVGHEFYPINPANFGPRLGVAYSPTPRTVLRAGAGIFYATYPLSNISGNIYGNTLTGTETLTQASNPGLGYPYTPFTNGTIPIPTIYGFGQPKPDLYSNQYNASATEELAHGIFAQLAYVGQHAVNLSRQVNVNLHPVGTTVRPNPAYSDIYVFEGNGFLSYNGLQAALKGHVKTLNIDVQYAWSHAIDNVPAVNTEPQDYNNIRAERSNGDTDQRQNLKYTLLYGIPMGEGHAFLGSSPSAIRTLASGWSVNSLGLFTSGIPVNVTQTTNSYGNGDVINQRPNRVQGVPLYLPKTINSVGGVTFLNPAAWQVLPATAGTFGNSPRNPVVGPHLTDLDMALMKTTPIHEGQTLQFRAEFFNVFNHPNFGAPTSADAAGSTTFGTITAPYNTSIGFGTPRQIQFVLKYLF